MAQRKTKAAVKTAPKAPHHRHARKPGWLRKVVTQTFTSMLAPLLVGLILQGFQGHNKASAPQPPRPAVFLPVASASPSNESPPRFESPAPRRDDVTRFRAGNDSRPAESGVKSY